MTGKERIKAYVSGTEVDHLPFMPIVMSLVAQELKVPYRRFCTDHRLIAQGQLAFAERYGADHLCVVTDPTVESADLGQPVIWYDDEPPANDEVQSLLMDKTALAHLKPVAPDQGRRMSNRVLAVRELAEKAGKDLLVEGWVEGPCAEASDLRGLSRLMMDFYDDPAFVRDLFALCTEQGIAFAQAQIDAGAEIVAVGDAASSLMGPEIFESFTREYHQAYVKAIHAKGALARLHICGNTRALMPLIRDIPYDIVDIDHLTDMAQSRASLGPDRVILGKVHTVAVMRDGTVEAVRSSLEEIYQDAGSKNYIVSAGCEIPRDSPPANLHAMLEFAMTKRV